MSKALSDISFAELLPDSIAQDETMQAAAQMLDGELSAIEDEISNALIWSRIDELQEPLLSYLAWQLHVEYWRPEMILAEKREMIKKAFILHSTKGTPGGIENAMAAAVQGVGGAYVEEWFEYAGDPFHFKVVVDIIGELVGDDLEEELLRIVNVYKNLRSQLDGFEYNLSASGEVPAMASQIYAEEVVSAYPAA